MTQRSARPSKQSSGARAARTSSTHTSVESSSRKAASRKAPAGKAATGKAATGKVAAGKAAAGKAATGKAARSAPRLPGTERARDEQRAEHGPQYGGGSWKVADERGAQRYGRARNDDADPSELAAREADNGDDESPSADDPELAAAEAAGEIEGSGQHAGMGRGDQPRKSKARGR